MFGKVQALRGARTLANGPAAAHNARKTAARHEPINPLNPPHMTNQPGPLSSPHAAW